MLRKTPKFCLVSWCESFAETHTSADARNYVETPHQEIK